MRRGRYTVAGSSARDWSAARLSGSTPDYARTHPIRTLDWALVLYTRSRRIIDMWDQATAGPTLQWVRMFWGGAWRADPDRAHWTGRRVCGRRNTWTAGERGERVGPVLSGSSSRASGSGRWIASWRDEGRSINRVG